MAAVDLPKVEPNSNKYRSGEQPTRTRTPKASVLKKSELVKPSGFEKFVRGFMTNDVQDIKRYVLYDVILPELRNIGMGLIDSFFRAKGIKGRGGGGVYYGNRSYDSYYNGGYGSSVYRDRSREAHTDHKSEKNDYRYVTIRERAAAERIIHKMREQIYEYGEASVADLLEFMGLENTEWTDQNFGWKHPDDLGVVSTFGGWRIDAREPRSLK